MLFAAVVAAALWTTVASKEPQLAVALCHQQLHMIARAGLQVQMAKENRREKTAESVEPWMKDACKVIQIGRAHV